MAFPLGGLGTGHVALCGDGALRQWQLLGVPNHTGFLPDSFFALRVSSLEPPSDVVRLLRSAPVAGPSAGAASAAAPLVPSAPNVSDDFVPAEAPWRWPFVAPTRLAPVVSKLR